jgi:hypothetical protein
MGTVLGGNHHIARLGKDRQGRLTRYPAVLMAVQAVATVEGLIPPPEDPIEVGAWKVAIGPIFEAAHRREVHKRLHLDALSITVEEPRVAYPLFT